MLSCFVYQQYKTIAMKTRLRTNKDRTSFELSVINKLGCEIYYFNNLEEAINYQNKITKQ